jgi:hypothetical protein
MGVPDMEAFWNDLSARKQAGKLGKTEEKFFKKWVKALGNLFSNPQTQQPGIARNRRFEPQARDQNVPILSRE